MSETTLRHIEHFVTTIGPRGTATPEEKLAHDYCQHTLEALGYEARREAHMAPISAWRPIALALGGMLLATAMFVIIGRGPNAQLGALAAAALGLITAVSFFLQTVQRDNPLKWLMPVAPSQNVWAVAPASGETRRQVVVTGHVDTHRKALAMRSTAWWQLFRVLTMLTGIAIVALVGLFVAGIFTPDPLLRGIALYLAILPAIGLVFTIQPDLTPFVKGANDNASGAATVLALAERLKQEPLAHTTVYLVNTGSEETACAGVADWIGRHAAEAPGASYLVLDNVAGKGSNLNYVTQETILVPVKSDAGLVGMAEAAARENPALKAQPTVYRGLTSELTVCVQHGQKALGMLNLDPRSGMPPHFHTDRDNLDNIDPDLLERSEQFAWAILKKIDAGAG